MLETFHLKSHCFFFFMFCLIIDAELRDDSIFYHIISLGFSEVRILRTQLRKGSRDYHPQNQIPQGRCKCYTNIQIDLHSRCWYIYYIHSCEGATVKCEVNVKETVTVQAEISLREGAKWLL